MFFLPKPFDLRTSQAVFLPLQQGVGSRFTHNEQSTCDAVINKLGGIPYDLRVEGKEVT